MKQIFIRQRRAETQTQGSTAPVSLGSWRGGAPGRLRGIPIKAIIACFLLFVAAVILLVFLAHIASPEPAPTTTLLGSAQAPSASPTAVLFTGRWIQPDGTVLFITQSGAALHLQLTTPEGVIEGDGTPNGGDIAARLGLGADYRGNVQLTQSPDGSSLVGWFKPAEGEGAILRFARESASIP